MSLWCGIQHDLKFMALRNDNGNIIALSFIGETFV